MIAIRFDGPPGPGDESGRFIEVERDGASIKFGEWKQDGDYWLLELTEFAQLEAGIEHIKAWASQSMAGLTHRQIADAFIRMCDDALETGGQA